MTSMNVQSMERFFCQAATVSIPRARIASHLSGPNELPFPSYEHMLRQVLKRYVYNNDSVAMFTLGSGAWMSTLLRGTFRERLLSMLVVVHVAIEVLCDGDVQTTLTIRAHVLIDAEAAAREIFLRHTRPADVTA